MTASKNLLSAAAVFLAACASSGGAESAPQPSPATEIDPSAEEAPAVSSTSASFTAEQADRGRNLFRAQCTECHYSSEFSDSQFQFKWSRRTAGNLYQLIQTSMPETAPGSLSPEETVDLVSYILRMNGFEPGSTELSADRALLDAIELTSIRSE